MVNVEIYQIKDIQNTKYAFMGYDYAKDKINIHDYRLVADFETSTYDLDKIYEWGNNGQLQKNFPIMRSMSMSDIIKVGAKYYYVDTFGFKEVEL